jgi:hypothetical protein
MALIRGCAVCGQRDTHPRHVVGIVNARTAPPTPKHFQCCADTTGCAACTDTVARSGGKTGQDLIDFLAAERAARTQEDTHG